MYLKREPKRIIVSMLAVCVVIVGLVFTTSRMNATQAGSVDCSGEYWNSPDPAVRDACVGEKDRIFPSDEEVEATVRSQPFHTALPYTPGPILPEPDIFKVVREIEMGPDNGPVPGNFFDAVSQWQDGSVPNSDYSLWDELRVITHPGNGYTSTLPFAGGGGVITATDNPTIETIIWGSVTGDPAEYQYQKVWRSPEPVGKIFITNIVNPDYTNTDPSIPYPGPQSMIYFTTPSGRNGTFDMATERWTFDSP